jgi:hypothetical protein
VKKGKLVSKADLSYILYQKQFENFMDVVNMDVNEILEGNT